MKPSNTVKWVLLFIAVVLIATAMQGQDSLRITITKARSTEDKTYYWFKDDGKNKYYTVCSCKQKHQKGDVVFIAKKDIEFIEGKIKFQ